MSSYILENFPLQNILYHRSISSVVFVFSPEEEEKSYQNVSDGIDRFISGFCSKWEYNSILWPYKHKIKTNISLSSKNLRTIDPKMGNNKAVLVDFPNCLFIRNSVLLLTSHIFEKTTRTGKVHFAFCDIKIDENLKFTLTTRKHAIRWISNDSPAKISPNNSYNYTNVSAIIQSKSLPVFRIVTSLNSMYAWCF